LAASIWRLCALIALLFSASTFRFDPSLILPIDLVYLSVVVGGYFVVVLFDLPVMGFDSALVLPVHPVDLSFYFGFCLSLGGPHFAFDLAWVKHRSLLAQQLFDRQWASYRRDRMCICCIYEIDPGEISLPARGSQAALSR
jgi:hypothetical protein